MLTMDTFWAGLGWSWAPFWRPWAHLGCSLQAFGGIGIHWGSQVAHMSYLTVLCRQENRFQGTPQLRGIRYSCPCQSTLWALFALGCRTFPNVKRLEWAGGQACCVPF